MNLSNSNKGPYNYLIVGAGILGLTIARTLLARSSSFKIAILEKEAKVASHASGRNSGVLHAGFYYTADSLKARFCVEGNQALHQFCEQEGLSIHRGGKLVVAQSESEVPILEELKRRGDVNGSTVELVSEEEAKEIDPMVRTVQKALYSPNTSTVDPKEVCSRLREQLLKSGVQIITDCRVVSLGMNSVSTSQGEYEYHYLVNAAGLYADQLAKTMGLSQKYSILPFKGLYLKCPEQYNALKTSVYPVPSPDNPFLGVHFTKVVSGVSKIGPTAVPALWRENYQGLENFRLEEVWPILGSVLKLGLNNNFNFRKLAIEEVRKYSRSYLLNCAKKLLRIPLEGEFKVLPTGIRAQLLDEESQTLVQDFVLEHNTRSTHILNAVSPAFTCSFPFAEYVVDKVFENQNKS